MHAWTSKRTIEGEGVFIVRGLSVEQSNICAPISSSPFEGEVRRGMGLSSVRKSLVLFATLPRLKRLTGRE